MTQRSLHLDMPVRRDPADVRAQARKRQRSKRIEVRDATPRKALSLPEGDFLRNATNGGRHLDDQRAGQVGAGGGSPEEQHGTATYWFRKLGPPDLELTRTGVGDRTTHAA
jgi:hypothetical protein